MRPLHQLLCLICLAGMMLGAFVFAGIAGGKGEKPSPCNRGGDKLVCKFLVKDGVGPSANYIAHSMNVCDTYYDASMTAVPINVNGTTVAVWTMCN